MTTTRQSLSRLTQLPSASLTAACSLAAFSRSPRRPCADGYRIPAARCLRKLARDLLAFARHNHRALVGLEEAERVQWGRDRHHEYIIDRNDHAGNAGDRTTVASAGEACPNLTRAGYRAQRRRLKI